MSLSNGLWNQIFPRYSTYALPQPNVPPDGIFIECAGMSKPGSVSYKSVTFIVGCGELLAVSCDPCFICCNHRLKCIGVSRGTYVTVMLYSCIPRYS